MRFGSPSPKPGFTPGRRRRDNRISTALPGTSVRIGTPRPDPTIRASREGGFGPEGGGSHPLCCRRPSLVTELPSFPPRVTAEGGGIELWGSRLGLAKRRKDARRVPTLSPDAVGLTEETMRPVCLTPRVIEAKGPRGLEAGIPRGLGKVDNRHLTAGRVGNQGGSRPLSRRLSSLALAGAEEAGGGGMARRKPFAGLRRASTSRSPPPPNPSPRAATDPPLRREGAPTTGHLAGAFTRPT